MSIQTESQDFGTKSKKQENSLILEDKEKFEDVLKRRFFYAPSAELYGGVAGLYDMGPIGASLESSLVDAWRRHFINEDSLLEIRASQLSPRVVLEASGHVDRFCDVMVKDSITGECFRCDHLLKAYFEKLLKDKNTTPLMVIEYTKILTEMDNFKKDDMQNIINKYQIVSPTTKNALSEPVEFNLMFSTTIGPTSTLQGFLRPETAQGIFTNFKRLLDFNNSKMPFAVAQVGFSFRNEISPRSGLIRTREFLMAEIEHFFKPDQKFHPKFPKVSHLEVQLYSSKNQLSGKPAELTKLSDAIDKKIINNNVLGYYIGRIVLFLAKIGIDLSRIRFRQHLPNEMAHYACDCWDCEIQSYYGWVECIGCADRSCYDLSKHSEKSGTKLVAQEYLSTPTIVKSCEIIMDKGLVGKTFREKASKIISHLETLSIDQATQFKMAIESNDSEVICVEGEEYVIKKNMIKSINDSDKQVYVKEYEPHVIEPSFGMGRILYSLLCHTVRVRENDENRIYFRFPALIAPIKCSVLPLSKKKEFDPIIDHITSILNDSGITFKLDDFGVTIGKRYSRSDELGIPFAITIDFDTLESGDKMSVTLRERDSTEQIRIDAKDLSSCIKTLVDKPEEWNKMMNEGGKFLGQTSIK